MISKEYFVVNRTKTPRLALGKPKLQNKTSTVPFDEGSKPWIHIRWVILIAPKSNYIAE